MAGEVILKKGSSKKFLDFFKVFSSKNDHRSSMMIPVGFEEAVS
jgi:hypothetical protein